MNGLPPSELRHCEWAYCMFSTPLLQHLLPLTFRPTPHTLLLSGCYMRRGQSDRHKSLVAGDFPQLGAHVKHYVCIFVHLLVCALPGDSQNCRLRRKNKVKGK